MAFKMKGMHFGEGTGSALKLFGLFGGEKEKPPPPPPPEIKVTPKQDKTNTNKEDDSNEEVKDNGNVSTTAGTEFEEQNLVYGQSNPNAQEAEDTIGEGARSIINRSKKFNV